MARSAPPPPRTTLPTLALALVGGLLAPSCGGDPPATATTTRSLLAQPAWERFDQPGRVAPISRQDAGPDFVEGWRPTPRMRRDGTVELLSTGERVAVTLLANAPRDRELVLGVRAADRPDVEQDVRLEVELNGQRLGSLPLVGTEAPPPVPAPREAWRAGENRLVLTRTGGTAEPGSRGLVLEHIDYDEPWRIAQDLAARTLSLPPGSHGAWWVTYASPGQLRLAGRASSVGTLALRFRSIDVTTGLATEDDTRLDVPVTSGEFERLLPLPVAGPRAVRIELAWSGQGDGPLELSALDLVEAGVRRRPPIVFVTLDTLSARHTSLYGYARSTTPTLEALAAEGVAFEQAISNAPWTAQSYFSQLTGQPAEAFSIDPDAETGHVPDESWVLPRRAWTLAEILRAAGYRTGGFVDSPWLLGTRGLGQGFEHFDDSAGRIPIRETDGGLRHELPRALAWLDGLEGDAPPFLFLHAKDIHGPYLPNSPYDGCFADDPHVDREHEARLGPGGETFGHIPPYIGEYAYPGLRPGARVETAPIVDAYDEGILEVDALVGELFDGLRARGVWEDALIVVNADHGESTVRHGLHFVHGLPYQDVLHVPLVLRLPGALHAGQRVRAPVQLLDLLPTMVALIDVEVAPDQLLGRSLVPLIEGGSLAQVPLVSSGKNFDARSVTWQGWKLVRFDLSKAFARPVLTHPRVRAWLADHDPVIAGQAERGLQLGDRPSDATSKVLVREARAALGDVQVELYYLPDDPHEEHDLSQREPERVAELLEILEADDARSARVRGMLAVDAEPGAVMTDAERAELEALGYADGEDP